MENYRIRYKHSKFSNDKFELDGKFGSLKRSLIFLAAVLGFHNLGMMDPALAESKDSKNNLITMTILYDNNTYDHRLKTAWGFSCLIELKGKTLLFDTGGDGRILLENMKILKKDPKTINTAVRAGLEKLDRCISGRAAL